jgi:hypothetical protein
MYADIMQASFTIEMINQECVWFSHPLASYPHVHSFDIQHQVLHLAESIAKRQPLHLSKLNEGRGGKGRGEEKLKDICYYVLRAQNLIFQGSSATVFLLTFYAHQIDLQHSDINSTPPP